MSCAFFPDDQPRAGLDIPWYISWAFSLSWIKGPGKRGHIVADTLLPVMFLGLRKLGNICCGHKMFLNKIRNIFCVPETKFVSATNVERAGKRGNICVGNNVSATMCPRLPGPLVYTFKLFDKAGKIPANMLLSNQWWISKNLPFRFFFPSFPLGFPSQPGRVLTSGSAGEHSLTHLFDFRLSVKPCLHSEQIPDVQLRQPRAQLSENNNSVNNSEKRVKTRLLTSGVDSFQEI